jgi:hypothetical protein
MRLDIATADHPCTTIMTLTLTQVPEQPSANDIIAQNGNESTRVTFVSLSNRPDRDTNLFLLPDRCRAKCTRIMICPTVGGSECGGQTVAHHIQMGHAHVD